MALIPRVFVPVLALAAGTWIGLGRPPPRDLERLARPYLDAAEARARAFLKGAFVPTTVRPPPPPGVEPASPPVNVDHLPDPAPWPRMNPEASLHKAWLLAEGPARAVTESRRLVTFTFDDGPFPETTPTVLRLLARHGIRGTFFFIGRYLDGDDNRAIASREVARQIVAAGHYVGNHTHDHQMLTLGTRAQALAQIDDGAASIEHATGQRPVFFRPPYGQLDPWSASVLQQRGLELVMWSIEVSDMKRDNVDDMVDSLKAQLEHAGGGIVLLHDIRPSSVQALGKLLDWLDRHPVPAGASGPAPTNRGRGYEIVDLVTYMRATASTPQPYADRAELEKARAAEWKRFRPRHRAPPPTLGNEGHDVVL